MSISRIIFKLSDITNHPLRNYKRYPQVERVRDIPFDTRYKKETMLDIYYPKESKGLMPVMVNVHGGGFVRGDKKFRSGIARYFASHGWFVVNTNYRLAPRHKFPAATEDTINALSFINGLGDKYPIDLTKIVVTGDSAGGYYAAHAVAAISNPELTKELNLPSYKGEKIRALLTFCAPFDLLKCFSSKVPFKVTVDITNVVFGTKYKDYNYFDFKYTKENNVLNYVDKNFPETFIVAAERDMFCGGQIEGMLEKLKENNIKHGFYIASQKGDGHCTHLLPFKKGTKPTLDAAVKFLEDIRRG